MSDERSQLRVLLELRESERDEATQTLADHNADASRLRREIERLQAELHELRERSAHAADGIDDTNLRGRQQADEFRHALQVDINRVARTIEERHDDLQAVMDRVAAAREELAAREAALQAVETRLEAHDEEADQIRQRRREAEMDEIALRRWKENNT